MLPRPTFTIRSVSDRVGVVRQQWDEAFRGVSSGPHGAIDPRLVEQMEAVTEALRRRIGGLFTLGELAAAYDRSDRWALAAIAERSTGQSWVRTASVATDAAFHLYARGARDYVP